MHLEALRGQPPQPELRASTPAFYCGAPLLPSESVLQNEMSAIPPLKTLCQRGRVLSAWHEAQTQWSNCSPSISSVVHSCAYHWYHARRQTAGQACQTDKRIKASRGTEQCSGMKAKNTQRSCPASEDVAALPKLPPVTFRRWAGPRSRQEGHLTAAAHAHVPLHPHPVPETLTGLQAMSPNQAAQEGPNDGGLAS